MFGNNAPDGAEILALLGMRPTTKHAPTLARPKIKFAKPRFVPTGSISAPDPSIRNSIQQTLAGVLSKAIDERQAHRLASRAMAPLTDATPLGNVTGAEEGGKQFYRGLTRGDLGTMALGAGSFLLSAAPLPGGVKRAGKRVGTGMFGSMLKDTRGTFGGVRARTADLPALKRAETMASSGASRDDIWRDTGWFKGADGKWRFEIDDSAARVASNPTDFGREVWGKPFAHVEQPSEVMAAKGVRPIAYAGVLNHPQLEAAYGAEAFNPHINWKEIADSPAASGHLDIRADRIEGNGRIEPSIHHELQHSIQEYEGFARGGSSDEFAGQTNIDGLDPYEQYRRLAGEVEARNVEKRLNWPPAQRINTPPWLSADTPEDLQIIRY